MTETPKVSCKYPEEWREVDDGIEETLGAMDASWHQDFSDNLHWISTNPNISESIRGVVQSYKKIRRNRFETKLKQKDSSYSRERDTLLADVKHYLGDNNLRVRRAEVRDAYGRRELPEDRVLLPRGERDIVALLDSRVGPEGIFDAAESLGLEPSMVWEDAELDKPWDGEEHMAVILPDTNDSASTRSGMSVSIYPDDEIYIIGGANEDREGVKNREPRNAYQPFYQEDASWNLKLLNKYVQEREE
jgi:hypothetical protein